MTKRSDEQASRAERTKDEQESKDLKLNKETLEDLDPAGDASDVRGGQTNSCDWHRGVCQQPNWSDACNASV